MKFTSNEMSFGFVLTGVACYGLAALFHDFVLRQGIVRAGDSLIAGGLVLIQHDNSKPA